MRCDNFAAVPLYVATFSLKACMSLNPRAVSLALIIFTQVLTPFTSCLTFFHFKNPRAVDPVASGRTGHAVEAFEVMPSLEFFKFGLINQLLVLDDLFLREVVTIPLDDSLESHFL